MLTPGVATWRAEILSTSSQTLVVHSYSLGLEEKIAHSYFRGESMRSAYALMVSGQAAGDCKCVKEHTFGLNRLPVLHPFLRLCIRHRAHRHQRRYTPRAGHRHSLSLCHRHCCCRHRATVSLRGLRGTKGSRHSRPDGRRGERDSWMEKRSSRKVGLRDFSTGAPGSQIRARARPARFDQRQRRRYSGHWATRRRRSRCCRCRKHHRKQLYCHPLPSG